MAIPNYIIPIKKGKKLFLYDPAINIHIISYLLTKRKKREGEGKERDKYFLFCLYDSAINIHVFMLGN